jgi:hypothetical protein
MPVGLFVISDERSAVSVWEVRDGMVRDRPAPELSWVFRQARTHLDRVYRRLVSEAGERLRKLGYTLTLAVGDGADGYRGGAPYDRVIATCSLPEIPAAWIDQAVPGARILVNLHRELGGGALALLGPSRPSRWAMLSA